MAYSWRKPKLSKGPNIIKTNYGSETVILLYITGCTEKIYSESAVVAKRRRLIRAIYFLTVAGDIKRYHRLRTVISLVSGPRGGGALPYKPIRDVSFSGFQSIIFQHKFLKGV